MSRWDDRVEDLLYDGETVVETVELGRARVVVTSHRVLSFTPEMRGANFRQVDRPNVVGLTTGFESEGNLLGRALKLGVVGVVLLVAGFVVDLDGILGEVTLGSGAGGVGIGGILGTIQGMLDLLRNLDQYMQLVGALVVLVALALYGVYRYVGYPTLVVEVAGGEGISLPRPDDEGETAGRLEAAILDTGDRQTTADDEQTPGGDQQQRGAADESPADTGFGWADEETTTGEYEVRNDDQYGSSEDAGDPFGES